MSSFLLVFSAIIIDIIFGDPVWLWHPIRFMGKIIKISEDFLYFIFQKHLKFAGIVLVIIIVGSSFLSVFIISLVLYKINLCLGIIFQVYILYTTLALRSLTDAGRRIRKFLKNTDIPSARKEVGYIVNRDMRKGNEQEIIRATLESLTENLSDGIIAPLFFAILGGAP